MGETLGAVVGLLTGVMQTGFVKADGTVMFELTFVIDAKQLDELGASLGETFLLGAIAQDAADA